MVDKRLFGIAPGTGKLVAAKVLALWANLLASIALVYTFVSLLGVLLLQADRHAPHPACLHMGGLHAQPDLESTLGCTTRLHLADAFWPLGTDPDSVAHIWQTYWPLPTILWYVLIFVCLALVKFLATRAASTFGVSAGERVKIALRQRLYQKLVDLGPSYAQRVRTSDVIQSMGEGIDQIQSFFNLFLPQLCYAILAPITLFIFVAPINLPAALVLLCCVPLIVLIVGLVAMRASRVFKQYWGKYTDMGAAFLDNLQGLETLKDFDTDEHAAKQLDQQAQDFREMTMKVLQIQLRSLTAMDIVAFGGAAAGIITAVCQYVANGSTTFHLDFGSFAFLDGPYVTVAGVVIIVLLSAEFFIPVRQLGSFFHVAMNGMTSTKRIFTLLDAPEPERGTQSLPADTASIGLVLRGVGYSYDDVASETGDSGPAVRPANLPTAHTSPTSPTATRDAIQSVSFTARPGTLTAVVGQSGSGKSTLAAVLAGQLTGYAGLVTLRAHTATQSSLDSSGTNYELSNFTLASLSQAVTLVDARSYLFTGTVRDNLLMANPQASDDQLMQACAAAHIDAFIQSKAEGLDFQIEPDAANLSGGQRQRLALARALLHDSPVLILDEITSSVDVDSEQLIMQTVHDLAKTHTVIMVTHRLANAVDADNVIVMDQGHVAEEGTHQQLMDAEGLYARMFTTQQQVEHVGKRTGAALTQPLQYGAPAMLQPAYEEPSNVTHAATDGSAQPRHAEETANASKRQADKALVQRLLREAAPLKKEMILACIFGTVGHLAATFVPVFGVIAIFCATGNPVWGMGLSMALTCCGICAAIRGILRYYEQYRNHDMAFRLLALLRHNAFAALRRLAPAKLEGHGKGELITLITTDVELLEIFFAHTISPVVIACATSLLYIITAFALFNPWIAVLMIVAYLIVGWLCPKMFGTSLQRYGTAIRDDSALLSNEMLDDMRGLAQIVHLEQADKRLARLMRLSGALRSQYVRMAERNGSFGGVTNAIVLLFGAIAAFITIGMGVSNPMNIGFDVTSFTLFVSSFGPVLALSALPGDLTQTFASARRLFALQDEVPSVVEQGRERPQYDGMAMRNVTFAYPTALQKSTEQNAAPTNRNVLESFNLDVPVTGILGLQGPSGRGKSTILKLLMRYRDPQTGSVTMSNCKLPDVDAGYRRHVQAMMGQETYLFDATVRDNLRIANHGASDAQLWHALEQASALELVQSMPDGLDTQVGELGNRMSQGERQRIGLARVFLRDADLILLDEPTSRLDALNEAYILQSINELAQSRNKLSEPEPDMKGAAPDVQEGGVQGGSRSLAVVLVSHRDSTMRICDSVLQI
ncbi:ATP-binding cassette domain-containing protein [Bifidobacterium gallicum]|uniref:ABC transporter ATP-binding protein n=1 Tax=Bifidobacterium gallicum DSM 20093 = LMG 11596 TaxID=561180 RepID=D1NWM6_9BIFI|nr:ATP-binding cassette domain-containing protein [Bifidobacterium gallicum]EFA22185.1 ABC transporter, ATP-binding protein [Bifidobacterium gallicum DSM 20093 = LMG 11596]KFI59076.1 ABC transporter ATP-binding protein [Bifidobacterium gallicum DSM 20093 = LMG 11596]